MSSSKGALVVIAFELQPPLVAEELNGATVSYGPRTLLFDVKQALIEGNGVIVTDDPELASTLRSFPVLQDSDVPEGAVPVVVPGAEDQPEARPPLYIPQEPLNIGPGVEAVHAPEPDNVEAAAGPPEGQDGEPTTDPATTDSVPTDNPSTSGFGRLRS